MRIDDGLVVFLALATGGVLLAGLAQALDARRGLPRARQRGPRADDAVSAAITAAPNDAPPAPSPPAPLFVPPVIAASAPSPLAPVVVTDAVEAEAALDAPGATTAATHPEGPSSATAVAPAPAAALPATPLVEEAVVEEPASPPARVAALPAPADVASCLRAYEAGEYDQAESIAAALARARPAGRRSKRRDADPTPLEQVALWSALGLSCRNRGDEVGATAAFESGAGWAGAVVNRRSPAALGRLAPRLGRDLLTVGEAMCEGSAARSVLRLAATWLAAGAAAAASDGDETALAARAGDAFAAAVQADVAGRIARREFAAAHGAIEDALGGIALPDARRGELRDLLWTSLTGEIGRLVGQALHGADRGAEDDGMAALATAAELVAGVPPGVLSPERHADLARRLWWAHMQLGGERRVRGELDGAAPPLLHALELAAGDPPREGEAREAVALVIEALAERLGQEIHSLSRRGDLDGAMAASRRLSEMIDEALARGLAPTDLSGALARRQEIMLELAEGRPA